MKLLFVHDHIFTKDKQGIVYSASAFPSVAWDRYLEHFDNLEVLARYKTTKQNLETNHVESTAKNVNFNFIKSRSTLNKLIKNLFRVDLEIESFIKDTDAVVVRLPSENGLIALELAIKYNKPIAVEVVGCIWDGLWNYGTLKAKLYAPFMYYRMKKSIRKIDLVLYVTEFFLQNRYPASNKAYATNISNINIKKVDKKILENRQNKIKNLFQRKIIFGIIGNYKTKYKGIDVAIKALSELDLNFELRILGLGDTDFYLDLAKKYNVEKSIVFSGSLPNGQPVYDWIDELDCYLQPSLQEGLPRALIEAMSRGCFCLASSAGGIPELLEKKFLHRPGDHEEFKTTIDTFIKYQYQEQILNEMERNFNHVKQYYREIIEVKRYSFYERLKTNLLNKKN